MLSVHMLPKFYNPLHLKIICTCVITLPMCYMKNAFVYSQSGAYNFFMCIIKFDYLQTANLCKTAKTWFYCKTGQNIFKRVFVK